MAAAPGLEEQSALEKTAKERQKLFVQFGIEQFNNALDVYRTAFLDPKEAQNSKFNKNGGKTVEAVAQTGAQGLLKLAGIDSIPCGDSIRKVIGKGIGKAAGWTAEQVFDSKERSNNKKTAQTVCQLLEGYFVDNKEWQCYLAKTFVKIFNHHHIQFVHLMERLPEDMPESKLMWKLAHDAVLKIFHALENEKDVEKRILDDKDFLIKAFIRGEVESGTIAKLISKMTMKKRDPHRQLRFLNKNGDIKKATTRDIFTEVDIYCPQTNTYYQAKGSNKAMLWRRQFWDVEDGLVEPNFTLNRNLDDPKLQEYEKRMPTFEQLPPFDKNEDYLHHIKLHLSVEKMEEDNAYIRQLLESMVSQNLVSKEDLKEELENYVSKEELANLNMDDLVKKVAKLELTTEKPFTVLMCGETGSGKSTLSTIMTGNKYKKFRVSKDSSNLTKDCENNGEAGHPFLGREGPGRKIRIIDAPGLGNSKDFQISDESIVEQLKEYMGKNTLQNNDKISALLWIENANSFSKSGAEKRVEQYIKRISPEAMKIIIMIFNMDFDDDEDSLANLKETFQTALSTVAENQFKRLSRDELKQSIDSIPCVLLKHCDGLRNANEVKDEVFDEYISDNEEELEKLLRYVEKNHANSISSFDVFNKSNQD